MYKTFAGVKLALASGVSVLSIVENYIAKIEENAALNAFLEVFEHSAKQQAASVDQKIENGDGSCIPKSYLCEVQVIILDEINRRKNKSDIFRIRRIMNLLNFFR